MGYKMHEFIYNTVSLAGMFIANTAWLNTIVGIGTVIWGILGFSAVILGGYLIEGARQQKRLEIKLTFSSSWDFRY